MSKNSHVKLTKVCDDCGNHIKKQLYQAIIRNRENGDGKDRCKECSYKISSFKKKYNIPYEKSLEYYCLKFDKRYLIDEYSHENEIKADSINSFSYERVIWNCPIYGTDHKYDMRIWERAHSGYNCPYCSNYRINHTNSLSKLFPNIAKEWHPTLNGISTPDDVGAGCSDKVWWICKQGKHEPFKQSILLRTKQHQGCPKCFGTPRKTTAEFKQDVYDLVNDEYSVLGEYINNNVKIELIHNVCHTEYKVAPTNFLRGNRCPACRESKGERKISEYLIKNEIPFEKYKTYDGLLGIGGRKLNYDFYIADKKLLIEYQGNFHDGSNGEFTKRNLLYVMEHDKRKREYVEGRDLRLLEIWYWDFDNICLILNDEFKNN